MEMGGGQSDCMNKKLLLENKQNYFSLNNIYLFTRANFSNDYIIQLKFYLYLMNNLGIILDPISVL